MVSVSVEILQTASELAALLPEWETLLLRSEFPVPFLHPLWHWIWWQVFGADLEMFVVTVRRAGKLIGLAPLAVETTHGIAGLGRQRRLRFLGSNQVCSDYLHILSAPEDSRQVAELVFRTLREYGRTWDVFDWTDVPETFAGHYFGLLTQDSQVQHARILPQTVCPYLPLPDSWDQLLHRLSPGMRKTVRNKWNRLHRRAGVHLRQPETAEEAALAFNDLVRLHQLRWNSSGLWGSFADQQFLRFHRQVVQQFFEKGLLRLFSLRIAGETVASLYGFVLNGRFFFYQMGADPTYAHDSVGLMVLAGSIRNAIEEGLHEYDFLRGNAEYKRRWRPNYRYNLRIWAHRPGLRNSLRYRGGRLVLQSKLGLKSVVPEQLWTEVRHLIHRRY